MLIGKHTIYIQITNIDIGEMESGTLARVLNDFFTTVDGELSLYKGEYFLVHRVVDKHWCYGESRDRIGKFPLNYLHEIELPRLSPSEEIFISIAAFKGEQEGDLAFSEGEIIIGLREVGNSWHFGCIQERKGIFPTSHTWQPNRAILKKAGEVKILHESARVTTSLKAQLNGELDLKIGDIVTVIRVLQDGWCYGRKEDGTEGTFPEGFVVYISDKSDPISQSVETDNTLKLTEIAAHDDSTDGCSYDRNLPLFGARDTDGIPKYHELFPTESSSSPLSRTKSSSAISCDSDDITETLNSPKSMEPSYALTLYAFDAEYPNELSFQPGEMIYLTRYINTEWLEGTKDGQRKGIFPVSYVNIVNTDASFHQGSISENGDGGTEEERGTESVRYVPQSAGIIITGANTEKKGDNHHAVDDSSFEDFVIVRSSETRCSDGAKRISEPHRSAPAPPPLPALLHSQKFSAVKNPDAKERGGQNARHDQSRDLEEGTIGPLAEGNANDDSVGDVGKERRADQRQNVISELVLTEREYVRDLKLTYRVFQLDHPDFLESRGIDVVTLFGNILDVIITAEELLDMILLAMKGIPESEQMIGPTFLKMAEKMQAIYVKYCSEHEAALLLLRKYEANQEIVNVFNKAIDTLRSQIACFDMSSILIKPVQRILKYPLILRELQKCTDDEHPDKAFINEACATMTRVADYINESKRRKDLVCKYLENENTLRKRIANLNMHSVAKISTRLSTKLSASFGLTNIPADAEFDQLEREFHSIEKCSWQLAKDVEYSLACLSSEALSGEVISDFLFQYYQGVSSTEPERLRDTRSRIRSVFLIELKSTLERRVITPINLLSSLLEGPAVLITKRQDKMLDYDAAISKSEKYKDSRIVQEELISAKCNFEALTQQLLEELPTLVKAATKILGRCISAYAHARKLLYGKITQRYLALCESSPQDMSLQDISESFLVNHNLLWNQMSRFAFARMSPALTQQEQMEEQSQCLQSDSETILLKSKYPTEKLYIVTENVTSTSSLDVGARKGTLVAVMKRQDPMGDASRWFIDNGHTKGFLPAAKLSPIGLGDLARTRHFLQKSDDKSETTSPAMPDLICMDSPKKEQNNMLKSHLDDLLSLNVQATRNHYLNNDFYYALFDFDTHLPGTLSVSQGQVVRLVRPYDEKGNSEWWFVEDRNQQSGYVPSNYLKELPPPHNH